MMNHIHCQHARKKKNSLSATWKTGQLQASSMSGCSWKSWEQNAQPRTVRQSLSTSPASSCTRKTYSLELSPREAVQGVPANSPAICKMPGCAGECKRNKLISCSWKSASLSLHAVLNADRKKKKGYRNPGSISLKSRAWPGPPGLRNNFHPEQPHHSFSKQWVQREGHKNSPSSGAFSEDLSPKFTAMITCKSFNSLGQRSCSYL